MAVITLYRNHLSGVNIEKGVCPTDYVVNTSEGNITFSISEAVYVELDTGEILDLIELENTSQVVHSFNEWKERMLTTNTINSPSIGRKLLVVDRW